MKTKIPRNPSPHMLEPVSQEVVACQVVAVRGHRVAAITSTTRSTETIRVRLGELIHGTRFRHCKGWVQHRARKRADRETESS